MDQATTLAPPAATRIPWQGLLLAVAVIAAYCNSLNTPFVFDDIPAIVDNPSIRSLWHPEAPPAGSAVAGRPVVNFSFALNYAAGGTAVWGYHLANLIIHLGATLLLGGIVQRTLRQPSQPGWLRAVAGPVGFSTAMLWALHPLQTESVTSVVQRTESLAGLVYLAALYSFVRGTEPGAMAPGRWLSLCAALCFTGMATKETTATLPLIILLYDRTFVAGSFREAGRRRWGLYGLLALSWLLLAVLMGSTGGRGGTVTLNRDVTAWMSLLTQSRAVAMYLQLAVWPHPLVLDYGDFVTDTVRNLGEVLPQFVLVLALGCTVIGALVRWPRAGFVGAWFFVILAPSSSFIPLLSQMRAEHRMYLPLAAVVVPLVLLVWRFAGRAAPAMVATLAVALGAGTVARNHDYRAALVLWTDTVQKQPGNPRAHYSLGLELARSGDRAGARREYTEAVRLKPAYFDARLALAGLLFEAGEAAAAQPHLAEAIHLGPETSNDSNNLGRVLLLSGDSGRAATYFETALRYDPDNHEAHNNLGYALAEQGRMEEAIGHYRRSVELYPGAVAWGNLGDALRQTGRLEEALASFVEAVRLEPGRTEVRFGLANTLAAAGRPAEALVQYQIVTRAVPTDIPALFNQGVMQRRLGQAAAARESFQQVLALDPVNAAAARQLEQLGQAAP